MHAGSAIPEATPASPMSRHCSLRATCTCAIPCFGPARLHWHASMRMSAAMGWSMAGQPGSRREAADTELIHDHIHDCTQQLIAMICCPPDVHICSGNIKGRMRPICLRAMDKAMRMPARPSPSLLTRDLNICCSRKRLARSHHCSVPAWLKQWFQVNIVLAYMPPQIRQS